MQKAEATQRSVDGRGISAHGGVAFKTLRTSSRLGSGASLQGDTREATSLRFPPRQRNEEPPAPFQKRLTDSSHPKSVFRSLLELTASASVLPTNMCVPRPEFSLTVHLFGVRFSVGIFQFLETCCVCPFLSVWGPKEAE